MVCAFIFVLGIKVLADNKEDARLLLCGASLCLAGGVYDTPLFQIFK
jgi:hypothetical protein